MRKLFITAALFLATTSAYAGNGCAHDSPRSSYNSSRPNYDSPHPRYNSSASSYDSSRSNDDSKSSSYDSPYPFAVGRLALISTFAIAV